MKSDDATLTTYASYLVKFVQAYEDEGIKVEYVALQNEPNYEQTYPSCHWDNATYLNLVKKLGPALTSAGVDAKVMLGTMSNGDFDPGVISAVMADSTAKGIVKIVGVQWGVLDKISSISSSGLRVGVTEHPNDQAYAKESWGEIKKGIAGKATAYNAWNMVLDKVGYGNDTSRKWAQNALLVVDGGKITMTPIHYVFRHFLQFVDPGAKVVRTTGGKLRQFNMPADGWATVKYKP